ncbi:MAG: hypothetical protein MHM6MM_000146 [Cercozoa sp. M6MM]
MQVRLGAHLCAHARRRTQERAFFQKLFGLFSENGKPEDVAKPLEVHVNENVDADSVVRQQRTEAHDSETHDSEAHDSEAHDSEAHDSEAQDEVKSVESAEVQAAEQHGSETSQADKRNVGSVNSDLPNTTRPSEELLLNLAQLLRSRQVDECLKEMPLLKQHRGKINSIRTSVFELFLDELKNCAKDSHPELASSMQLVQNCMLYGLVRSTYRGKKRIQEKILDTLHFCSLTELDYLEHLHSLLLHQLTIIARLDKILLNHLGCLLGTSLRLHEVLSAQSIVFAWENTLFDEVSSLEAKLASFKPQKNTSLNTAVKETHESVEQLISLLKKRQQEDRPADKKTTAQETKQAAKADTPKKDSEVVQLEKRVDALMEEVLYFHLVRHHHMPSIFCRTRRSGLF